MPDFEARMRHKGSFHNLRRFDDYVFTLSTAVTISEMRYKQFSYINLAKVANIDYFEN